MCAKEIETKDQKVTGEPRDSEAKKTVGKNETKAAMPEKGAAERKEQPQEKAPEKTKKEERTTVLETTKVTAVAEVPADSDVKNTKDTKGTDDPNGTEDENINSGSPKETEDISHTADKVSARELANKKANEVSIGLEQPKRRHNRHLWLWWMIGIAVIALLGLGGYGIFRWWDDQSHQDNVSETEPNSSEEENKDTPSEGAEPEPETPPEQEKPEEQPPQTTTPPTEQPLDPIAQRPTNTDYPEITGGKLIALTFDDGPSSVTTPRLLDILKGRNAKATFFVLGTMASRSPDLLRREVAEGHEVASHTPYHNQQTLLSASQIRAEAIEMDRIFTEILGTVPPFTRPPYGSYNDIVRNAMGQPLVLWSIDPRDWADRNANTVCSRVTSAAFNGAIILVHDIHSTTVDAVPCIIDNLRAQGYQFVTVSELAAARDVPLVSGGVYGSF